MPQRMHAYLFLNGSFLQRFADDVLNAPLAHRFTGCEAFKQILFGFYL